MVFNIPFSFPYPIHCLLPLPTYIYLFHSISTRSSLPLTSLPFSFILLPLALLNIFYHIYIYTYIYKHKLVFFISLLQYLLILSYIAIGTYIYVFKLIVSIIILLLIYIYSHTYNLSMVITENKKVIVEESAEKMEDKDSRKRAYIYRRMKVEKVKILNMIGRIKGEKLKGLFVNNGGIMKGSENLKLLMMIARSILKLWGLLFLYLILLWIIAVHFIAFAHNFFINSSAPPPSK